MAGPGLLLDQCLEVVAGEFTRRVRLPVHECSLCVQDLRRVVVLAVFVPGKRPRHGAVALDYSVGVRALLTADDMRAQGRRCGSENIGEASVLRPSASWQRFEDGV